MRNYVTNRAASAPRIPLALIVSYSVDRRLRTATSIVEDNLYLAERRVRARKRDDRGFARGFPRNREDVVPRHVYRDNREIMVDEDS